MKYRLIALDLDGTLLGPDHRVSDANVAAILAAQAAGAMVVPCTGRGWRESVGWIANVTGLQFGVFNTGAVVVDMADGRAIDVAAYEPALALELVEFLRDLPDAVLVYQEHGRTGREYLVTGDGRLMDNTRRWFEMNDIRYLEQRHPREADLHHCLRVGVVVGGEMAFDVERRVTRHFADRVDLHCFPGVPTAADPSRDRVFIVEIFPKGVNKWRGVAWLAEQHGIDPAQVATVGDEINDTAMIRHAGLGVAMGNARDAIKQLADRQTLPHVEDGVAHAIRQMLAGHW